MRLIDVETLTLQEFLGDDIPPYTILSHTWGSQEISYEQFIAPHYRIKTLEGFKKIQNACRITKEHGYYYTWVDACCIDKRSSADLSEAINSMFKWYAQAEWCYAYLEDVVSLEDLSDTSWPARELGPDMSIEEQVRFDASAFASSRWFTRGWTLQELIAPRSVLFYGHYWNLLGSKNGSFPVEVATAVDLCWPVFHVTEINIEVLRDPEKIFSPSLCVANKMCWAARRSTSRLEDRAYCLLGIFDLTMPLLYGEGTKAFVRLQEELFRRSDDLSILLFDSDEQRFREEPFADSPDRFRSGNRIASFHPDIVPFEHAAMSNSKGLSLRLPIVEDANRHGVVLGVLSFRYTNDSTGPIGIVLKQSRTKTREYCLASTLTTDGLAISHHDTVKMPYEYDVQDIFLCKPEPSRAVTFNTWRSSRQKLHRNVLSMHNLISNCELTLIGASQKRWTFLSNHIVCMDDGLAPTTDTHSRLHYQALIQYNTFLGTHSTREGWTHECFLQLTTPKCTAAYVNILFGVDCETETPYINMVDPGLSTERVTQLCELNTAGHNVIFDSPRAPVERPVYVGGRKVGDLHVDLVRQMFLGEECWVLSIELRPVSQTETSDGQSNHERSPEELVDAEDYAPVCLLRDVVADAGVR